MPLSLPSAPRGGRFLIVDFLASRQSSEAALVMETAGLAGTKLFSLGQVPNACGHLSAIWACEARSLGDQFHTFDMMNAAFYNTVEQIEPLNAMLPSSGMTHETTRWLLGDEILSLATT